MKRKFLRLSFNKDHLIEVYPVENLDLVKKIIENYYIDFSIFEEKEFKYIKFSDIGRIKSITFYLKKYKDISKKLFKLSNDKGHLFPYLENNYPKGSHFLISGMAGSGKSIIMTNLCKEMISFGNAFRNIDIGFNTHDYFILDEAHHINSYRSLAISLGFQNIRDFVAQPVKSKKLNDDQKNLLKKIREEKAKRSSFWDKYKKPYITKL